MHLKMSLRPTILICKTKKSLEAWTFICMIALQWYYDLSERLKKAELSNRYAPMDMVRSPEPRAHRQG